MAEIKELREKMANIATEARSKLSEEEQQRWRRTLAIDQLLERR